MLAPTVIKIVVTDPIRVYLVFSFPHPGYISVKLPELATTYKIRLWSMPVFRLPEELIAVATRMASAPLDPLVFANATRQACHPQITPPRMITLAPVCYFLL